MAENDDNKLDKETPPTPPADPETPPSQESVEKETDTNLMITKALQSVIEGIGLLNDRLDAITAKGTPDKEPAPVDPPKDEPSDDEPTDDELADMLGV